MLGFHSLADTSPLCLPKSIRSCFRPLAYAFHRLCRQRGKKTARRKSIEFIRNLRCLCDFLRTAIPGLFGTEWSAGHQAAIEALVEKGRNFSPEALIQYYEAMIARPDQYGYCGIFAADPCLSGPARNDNAVLYPKACSNVISRGYRITVHILRNSAHMGYLGRKRAGQSLFLYLFGIKIPPNSDLGYFRSDYCANPARYEEIFRCTVFPVLFFPRLFPRIS